MKYNILKLIFKRNYLQTTIKLNNKLVGSTLREVGFQKVAYNDLNRK
jgi:hypothetical protein